MKAEVIERLYEPLTGGDVPLIGGDGRVRDETNWARNHAIYWAEQAGVPEEHVDGFAQFFAKGWVDYLQTHAAELDSDFRKMFDTYMGGIV